MSTYEGPQCEGAPHFYLITGDPADEMSVIPFSAQHCCMDHSDNPCYGWICLNMNVMGETEWPTPEPFVQVEESPHQSP